MATFKEIVETTNDIAKRDQDTTQLLKALIGETANDIVKLLPYVSTIAAAVDIINRWFGTSKDVDTNQKELWKRLNDLKDQLDKIIGSNAGSNYLASFHALDDIMGDANSVYSNLAYVLPASPDRAARAEQIRICLATLKKFEEAQQSYWKVVFYDQLYYSDPYIGQIRPSPDREKLAFSTRYNLAAYMRALHYYIAVGGALDAKEFVNNSSTKANLQASCNQLETVYKTAVAGITPLPIPTQRGLLGPAMYPGGGRPNEYDSLNGYVNGFWAQAADVEAYTPPHAEFCQMYGAVDIYGTCFVVGNYPGVPCPPHPPPAVFYPKFRARLELQRMNAWRIVYFKLGLQNLRDAINIVRELLGLQPFNQLDPSAWSVREINQALGTAFPGLITAEGSTIKGTINRLYELKGSLPESPLSLRTALQANLIAIELRGVKDWMPDVDRD